MELCADLSTDYTPGLFGVSYHTLKGVVVSVYESLVVGPRLGEDPELVTKVMSQVATALGDMQTTHPHYGDLAARIIMSELYMHTPRSFDAAMKSLHDEGILADEVWAACKEHKIKIKRALAKHTSSDFVYCTFQGVHHLIKSFLLKVNGKVVERPRYMYMRMALGLHPRDINMALETFALAVDGTIMHASPTMFNAGTTTPQLASCFIQTVDGTNEVTRADTFSETAAISMLNGGIGVNVDGSDTTGYNCVLDKLIKDTPQGGSKNNKRPGAGAIYREVWEADALRCLANKRSEGGDEDERCQDLFVGLWICDLFMKRLTESLTTKRDITWSFFQGDEARVLRGLHGMEFEKKYLQFEADKKHVFHTTVQRVMTDISKTFKETGGPYILFKDTCNARSNHSNRGTLRGSNLCAEILQYSDTKETAVCILGSVCVSKFLAEHSDESHVEYDFDGLGRAVRVLVRNLNRAIDRTTYPSDKAKRSNRKMRPIGIGIRDLQGLFVKANLPYTSSTAQMFMMQVMQTIYYNALSESVEEAKIHGPYPKFEGSMFSRGVLQQDVTRQSFEWKVVCGECGASAPLDVSCEFCHVTTNDPPQMDWAGLKRDISERYGIRNSLLTALMPTVGTSQIFGTYESFEPMPSLMHFARVNSGEFQMVNRDLVEALDVANLWTPEMKNRIIRNGGSLKGIKTIPKRIKSIFKTVWDIPQMDTIRMAAMRGAFVDQSQSLNIYLEDPTLPKHTTLMVYAWKCGLKTGSYYHRSKAATDAVKVTCLQNDVDGCMSCTA